MSRLADELVKPCYQGKSDEFVAAVLNAPCDVAQAPLKTPAVLQWLFATGAISRVYRRYIDPADPLHAQAATILLHIDAGHPLIDIRLSRFHKAFRDLQDGGDYTPHELQRLYDTGYSLVTRFPTVVTTDELKRAREKSPVEF